MIKSEETEAAFSSAVLVTLVGSITPDLIRFSYFSVAALNPKSSLPSNTFCNTTDPSRPALFTICLNGSSRAL